MIDRRSSFNATLETYLPGVYELVLLLLTLVFFVKVSLGILVDI